MSRVGKAPIALPQGVTITVSADNVVTVKGPKGQLQQAIDSDITIAQEDGQLLVQRPSDQKRHKALHGLYRALLNNMVIGVTEGYKVTQELVGVGYRATNTGNTLDLVLGFSHHYVFELPQEIKVTTTADKGKNPTIILESIDKQLIGQVAAKIRSLRAPEPYKGKGIKFQGEILRRKAGKSASKK
ncbi:MULTISPECIES: 50S ribosomal protein L6 [Mucilaginibacter]|jgi:large subunit ribosomal protein L6|uniref:Large ribosomal subunit protein uL6 n=1 Tax=Mucilaginibacter gossypii TaxID=551996 RepID=A0A1G7VRQ1_9SPHI|nr:MULTISPECIES: 50S ribosomal protein L6 [Mucilaginibacter]NVM66215.1 large subunit ribosomal protein L6 [Mucilaginibacter sp. SG538B]QTE34641.1 50S ribosomal protein L6 [Mucilaginibacter gossypii]RAV57742.1 50S ribosomal protein L6 [Mucilaginibacter rubeus]WEA03495.1 50S ribosomal protein L6 [Mucilaginibacter sp. SJ]SCW65259.1 LSU ribosomal protein L6P [Mucilaginibacter sp. NFR10]